MDDKQRGPSRNLTLKGSIRKVEAGTGDSGGKRQTEGLQSQSSLGV